MKNQVCAGSILPFAIAPTPEGDMFFLLGKEEVIPGWKYGSNRWADFGGGVDAEDRDMEETSAREFVEETMAVIPFNGVNRQLVRGNHAPTNQHHAKSLFTSIDELSQSLRDESFRHKIIMSQTSARPSPKKSESTPVVHNRSTVTYIKQIPWDPNLPRYFDSIRRKMVKLRNTAASYHEQVPLVTDKRIVPGHVSKRGILANVQYVRDEHSQHCEVLLFIWNSTSRTLRNEQYVVKDMPPRQVREFVDSWQLMRQAFYRLPHALRPHPGIKVDFVENTSLITDVAVNRCYFEKQSVQWWSLHRLKEVIKHGGTFRGDLFRSKFLPVLAVGLKLMEESSNDSDESSNLPNPPSQEKCEQTKCDCPDGEHFRINVKPWKHCHGKNLTNK